ncbi:MAG: hypothetical protein L3J10_06035 [Sulfurimonas sp.]|nr:hypothetical protein [Sulfurimonas sp.]
MQNDFINMIEPTPILKCKKCKMIAFLIKIFLQYSIYIIGIITWFLYDYFIAGAIFLLSYIVIGIIRAKLRNSVIPTKQREYHYNDKDIADWYTAKELCYEDENTSK